MATRIIVLVADRDDPKHGEIKVVDSTTEAERLVETLLEAGIEQERMRFFTGAEIDAQVTHRPVVALVGEGLDGSAEQETESEEASDQADEQEENPGAKKSRSSFFRSA